MSKKEIKKNNKSGKWYVNISKVITWPFVMIATALKNIWIWICKINLVGLANCALLVAIIVLFSVLIMDFIGCQKKQAIVATAPVPVPVTLKTTEVKTPALPLPVDINTRKKTEQSVRVVPVAKKQIEIVKKQTAIHNKQFWGDVIIDNRSAGALIQNNTKINGNLYLQNMRKYVLPCGIHINGNLFLRDVNMLQFCGDFIITGNIYVSPHSSFGPIPKSARLGGYVVL